MNLLSAIFSWPSISRWCWAIASVSEGLAQISYTVIVSSETRTHTILFMLQGKRSNQLAVMLSASTIILQIQCRDWQLMTVTLWRLTVGWGICIMVDFTSPEEERRWTHRVSWTFVFFMNADLMSLACQSCVKLGFYRLGEAHGLMMHCWVNN